MNKIWCTLWLVVLAGCQNNSEKKDAYEELVAEWRDHAKKLREVRTLEHEPSTDREVALDEKKNLSEKNDPALKLPDQMVSVKFHKLPLSQVLRSLGQLADLNLVVDDSLQEPVTLHLKDISWHILFENLLETYSLDYVYEPQLLRVVTPASIEKKLALEEMKEKLNQARERVSQTEPLEVKLYRVNHLNVEKTAGMLRKMLAEKEVGGQVSTRGSVEIDEENNTLILKAVAADLERMLKLVKTLDKPATQVLVEAQIVVTNQRTARALGMQWGGVFKAGNNWITAGPAANIFADGSNDGTLTDAVNPTFGQIANFPILPDIGDGSGGSTGGSTYDPNSGVRLGFLTVNSNMILHAQLSALEADGAARILSSPTITTLDNVSAFIESGSEIPYQSTSDNQGTTTEFKKAVLRLEVTPHVIDDKLVKLKVKAVNDEPDQTITNKDLEPAITTRRAETTVLLRDGQTTVIAGLSKEYDTQSDTGWPIIRDIPYLGKLFGAESADKQMSDLMIFITPQLIIPQEVSADLKEEVTQ